jgi:hypothetical protein
MSLWFISVVTGEFWSVDDPVAGCLEYALQPLLAACAV